MTITSGFLFLLMFSFTMCIPTPWIFAWAGFLIVVKNPKSWGIWSWGFRRFICPSVLLVFHRPNSSNVSLLSACQADLSGICLSLLPCLFRGSSDILRSNSMQLKGCLRNYCPCRWLFSSHDKEGLLQWLSHSPADLLIWPYFLVFCEERDINVE